MRNFIIFCFAVFATASQSQVITFDDPVLKSTLLQASPSNSIATNATFDHIKIDSNDNGEIEVSEALQVRTLQLSYFGITSIAGIEHFANLQNLYCNYTQIATVALSGLQNLERFQCRAGITESVNISDMPMLEEIDVSYNPPLTSVVFSNLPALETLRFSSGTVSSASITDCPALDILDCYQNNLTSLDVSDFPLLTSLNCSFNEISALDVTANPLLEYLSCGAIPITELDLSSQSLLQSFFCPITMLTTIDVSNQHSLTNFYCYENPNMVSVFMKNGVNFSFVSQQGFPGYDIHGLPSLQYVCADEDKIAPILSKLADYGQTDVNVNSFCSFSPGGDFYQISGNYYYDGESNGCLDNNALMAHTMVSISDGNATGVVMSDGTGQYGIPVQAGSYTITPIVENPSFFTISPAATQITFPDAGQIAMADFCISPNGSHRDVEATLLPVVPARPGFDAVYKIIYRNIGTMTDSGVITLNFDDAFSDFISSSVPATVSPGMLSWNYSALPPFATVEITVTLNINSPTETPAVNAGDILHFTTSIMSTGSDENLANNEFALNQEVLGAIDPNDKTCLQGDVVSTEIIGNYVHYLIRFENTGTYAAENVVVEDIIDTTKFDIGLVPLHASHPYYANISEGNKVRFIFENIMLPFEDNANDGYIAFKIKTLPTLVAGETFSNAANIFFDYNFPVATNSATTLIQTLSINDFNFGDHFTLFPNPATSVVYIRSDDNTIVSSVDVYDVMGRNVISVMGSEAIDVTRLAEGTYYAKVTSAYGTSVARFIKK